MVWLLKVNVAAERLTMEAVPVPVRVTVCGLLVALSAIVTEALRLRIAVGVNFTVIVQVPFAVTVLEHVLV
jgi:hypothetical protein